jgi:hypothetical protein
MREGLRAWAGHRQWAFIADDIGVSVMVIQ